MLVDTHAHLTDPRFIGEEKSVIERAKEAGIERVICPSGDLVDAKKVVELADKYQEVYGCVGMYPGAGQKSPNWREDLAVIRGMIENNKKIVGVGEIGLDSYWVERDEATEKAMFVAQLEMASEIDKPVIIHNRLCHKLMRELIGGMNPVPRGVFHCFSGDREFLEWVLAKGFYVGFGGNVTYPSNQDLRELVKLVPEERLLLETDSPYLPPAGRRGERNEPANVRITAQMIADLRGQPLKELEEQTTRNAEALFKL